MSPDGSAKPLPEERLLKLIRGKSARLAQAPAGAGQTAAAAQAMGRGGPARRWPQAATFGLGAVLALEVAVLVVEALRPAPTITMPVVSITQEPSPRPAPPPSLAQSATRPLFSAPSETAASPTPGSQGPSVAVTQLATRLTLLGIVAGEPGQAIIEDSQTQKTYFVSPGQPVTEGAVVDQVLENEVILSLHGETIRLSL